MPDSDKNNQLNILSKRFVSPGHGYLQLKQFGNIMDTLEKPPASTDNLPLRELVKRALQNYFTQLDGQTASNLYDLVITEVEGPLLEETLKYTKNGHSSKHNQSKAAEMLGLSRGTLRKKLQQHDLL